MKLNDLIRQYMGTPYKNRKDDNGLDCFQWIQVVYKECCGITFSDYAPNNLHLFYEYWCSLYGWEFPWTRLQEYDLLLIHPVMRPVDHVAIIMDTENLVHSIEPIGVCVEKIQKYKSRIFQVARLRTFGEEYDNQAKELMLRAATYQKEQTYDEG